MAENPVLDDDLVERLVAAGESAGDIVQLLGLSRSNLLTFRQTVELSEEDEAAFTQLLTAVGESDAEAKPSSKRSDPFRSVGRKQSGTARRLEPVRARATATAGYHSKALSKQEILAAIAEGSGVSKKSVAAVLEALGSEIKKAMDKKGPGTFSIPGLVRIEKKKTPARPERKQVPNPFRPGELMDVAAKPASTKIRVRALKQLKGMA